MTPRYISGLLGFTATIFIVGQALALETLPGEPEIGNRSEANCERATPLVEPLALGRVVAVDRAAGKITLEFRPITELLPEGGTRIFQVEDPTSLKGLTPGDKVRFEVERNGRSFLVTRIENSN
jgi:Cu(I)/Ag(I) efflux system protein CusF